MRPLRLAITAFGPYADTEIIDFAALDQLGLFAVAGDNGSGKTTIFDALHFALYGTLPGRRRANPRMRSDHADPAVVCRVVLDFAAQGKQWRVERSPKQVVAKQRGTGLTERDPKATLYEIVDDQPVAVANRLNEVRDRCQELVGLSGEQFERVALLPQGEFSRLLQEGGTNRRDLLRKLFSSAVFGDAASWLKAQARDASADGAARRAGQQRHLLEISEALTELVGEPVRPDLADLQRHAARFRLQRLAELDASVEQHTVAARLAADAERGGRQAQQLLERHAELTAKLRDHAALGDGVATDEARLDAARAAVPVVGAADAVQGHRRAVNAHQADIERLAAELHDVVDRAGLAIDLHVAPEQVRSQLDVALADHRDRLAATKALRALRTSIQQATAEHDTAVAAQRSAMARHRSRTEHRDRAVAELQRLDDVPSTDTCHTAATNAAADLERHDAHQALTNEHARLAALVTKATSSLQVLTGQLDQAVNAAEQQGELDLAAERAAQRLEVCVELGELDASIAGTESDLERVRAALSRAVVERDRRFDAFVKGASVRLAATLTPDEPCPVCGSCAHPAPAAGSGEPVTQAELDQSRAEADRLTDRRHELETRLVGQTTRRTELEAALAATSDSSDLDWTGSDPVERVQAATSTALAAQAAADTNRTRALDVEAHRASVDQAQQQIEKLDADRDRVERELERSRGALGEQLDTTRSELLERAAAATALLRQSETADHRRTQLGDALARLDQEIATIDLERLELDNRLAGLDRAIRDRRSELESAEARLPVPLSETDLVAALAALEVAQTCAGNLSAATGRHDASTEALRRSELTLGERLTPSPFATVEQAEAAHLDADTISVIEQAVAAHRAADNELRGQLQSLGDPPTQTPDLAALTAAARAAERAQHSVAAEAARLHERIDNVTRQLERLAAESADHAQADARAAQLERVAAMVNGDNAHNLSLENWVLAAHLRDVVDLANLRLARSTGNRFQLRVSREGDNRRNVWGLELQVEDTVTGTLRSTTSLSGGELFQASLALALGLADAVMQHRSGVQIDALFIDEGFGSLDEQSVERVIDLLDDVRTRGATVGVITHVRSLLDALPIGISVQRRSDGTGSTVAQPRRAA